MSKELIVSANRHETRVAVLEDDQVVEVYYQREKEYSLAGSIHKGRVTRVLPGMQSAFVDIGLDRDAFLYVSDFFEDNDEYDKIVTSVEEKVLKMEKGPMAPPAFAPALAAPSREAEPASLPDPEPAGDATPVTAAVAQPAPAPLNAPGQFARKGDDRDRGGGRRSRRRRPKGRGLPDSKYFSPGQNEAPELPPATAAETIEAGPERGSERGPERGPERGKDSAEDMVVLPGESLAKYRGESVQEHRAGSARLEPESREAADAPEPAAPEVEAAPEMQAAAPSAPVEQEALAAPPSVPEAAEQARLAEIVEFADDTEAILTGESAEGESAEGDSAEVEPTEGEAAAAEPAEQVDEDQLGPEPARIPTSLTATLREQGGRYPHRVSRRMRRRGRPEGGDAPQRGDAQPRGDSPQRGEPDREARPQETRPDVRQAARPEPVRAERPAMPSISDLLREGQEIIVQIAKEPLGQDRKSVV